MNAEVVLDQNDASAVTTEAVDDVPIYDDISSLESSFSQDEDVAESNVINEDEELDVFLKAVAIKFNDWMHLKHIPYSTCNLIVQEVFNSYSEGKAASPSNETPKQVSLLSIAQR